MVRSCVLWCLVYLASASSLLAFDDRIPASEILKVWKRTAINCVAIHFEDISRTFAEVEEDPFSESDKNSKLIVVTNAIFRRAKGLGMKAQYHNDAQSTCNLLNGVGASSRKSSPYFYEIWVEPEGRTHMEAATLTEAMLIWLDPAMTPVGKALIAKGDAKLKVTQGKMGNRQTTLSAAGNTYLLAEEYDWRVVEVTTDRQKGVPPQWTFEYDRAADKKLVLKRAVSTASNPHEQFGWMPAFSSEFTVTEASFAELTETDISIKFSTPAIIHDNTGPSPKEFIMHPDGSKAPYSKAEYQKLIPASAVKKNKAAQK